MPFIAECPFCGGKLRAPDHAVGRSLPCPKCGEPFTLAPVEQPLPSGAFTPTAAVHPDTTTAPLQVSGGSQPALALPPVPVPAPVKPAKTKAPPRRRFNPAAVAAFFFASVGVLLAGVAALSWFDIAAQAAVVFAGLGLLLGLAGLLVASAPTRGGLGLSLAGAGVSLPLLAVLIFRPAWLGIFPSPPPRDLTEGRTVVVAVGKETPEDDREPEWIDVRGKELQQDDLRVRVVSVTTRLVEFKKPAQVKPPLQRFLVIGLRISNVGSKRRIPYESWGETGPGTEGRQARLTDDKGKSYRLRNFDGAEVAGRVRSKNLPPGGIFDDVLVFETPASSVPALRLELPAEAAGGTGTFKLRIPREAIVSR